MVLLIQHFRKYVTLTVLFAFVALSALPSSAQFDESQNDPLLIQKKIQWSLSDMERLVEQIRRIDDPWPKRLLVEEVEAILYREAEFPLYTQGGGINRENVNSIASLQGIDQRVLSELYARAFALAGIAKSYEGYIAAGEDYLALAQDIFPETPSLTMKIDSFENAKTVRDWIAEASKIDKNKLPVKITFKGKTLPSAEVVENLNHTTVRFETDQADMEYLLFTAAHDFIKGVLRKATLSDIMAESDSHWFSIYLPPGKYRLVITLLEKFTSDIVVSADPHRNEYLIEGMSQGLTVYASPTIKDKPYTEKLLETKKNTGLPSSAANAGK